MSVEGVGPGDAEAVRRQLGRPPRGAIGVHRCPCALPDVVVTSPRLPDGTPFPTSFYLTCPRASARVGTLESTGEMASMTARLSQDPDLAAAHERAHHDYLARRAELANVAGLPGDVPEIAGTSAGGMPSRVKCLHVLLAHSLVAGPGTTPLGDEVREAVGEWWAAGPCVGVDDA